MKTMQLAIGKMFRSIDIIKTVVDQPCGMPGVGITRAEMLKRDRIFQAVEKLEPGATELALEDADMDFLKGLVDHFQFNQRHGDLIAFFRALDEAR